jgi:hypothetical protein
MKSITLAVAWVFDIGSLSVSTNPLVLPNSDAGNLQLVAFNARRNKSPILHTLEAA